MLRNYAKKQTCKNDAQLDYVKCRQLDFVPRNYYEIELVGCILFQFVDTNIKSLKMLPACCC